MACQILQPRKPRCVDLTTTNDGMSNLVLICTCCFLAAYYCTINHKQQEHIYTRSDMPSFEVVRSTHHLIVALYDTICNMHKLYRWVKFVYLFWQANMNLLLIFTIEENDNNNKLCSPKYFCLQKRLKQSLPNCYTNRRIHHKGMWFPTVRILGRELGGNSIFIIFKMH